MNNETANPTHEVEFQSEPDKDNAPDPVQNDNTAPSSLDEESTESPEKDSETNTGGEQNQKHLPNPINTDFGDENDSDTPHQKETTRSKFALVFLTGFFAVIFICILYAFLMDTSVQELKDFLTAIVGALSGILGFIIGYYFKSEQ